MNLRDVGDEACALRRRIATQWFAGKPDLAGMGPDESEQGFEQRGFSPAIGAKQCQHFATRQRDAQLPSHDTARIADGQVFCVQDHDQLLCALVNSQMKNGVPMTAVRMPSGISTAAAARATVSMSNK